MKLSIWDILTAIVIIAILCLGCAFTQVFANPASPINPFPPPTTIPRLTLESPTEGASQNGQVFPPTWTFTPTVAASATPQFVLRPSSTLPPTATQYFMPTATNVPPASLTPTPTRQDARCQVVEESPVDDTRFNAGQDFDKRWVIKNLSGSTWRSDSLDIKFISGTRMQTGSDTYDLQSDVPDNGTFTFTVDMRAPTGAGTYIGQWALVNGSTSMCNFNLRIIVR